MNQRRLSLLDTYNHVISENKISSFASIAKCSKLSCCYLVKGNQEGVEFGRETEVGGICNIISEEQWKFL